MNSAYPETIYATHEDWGGETYYAGELGMLEMVRNYHELGEEWESIELSDCDQFGLVHDFGTHALYREKYVRGDNYVLFEREEDSEDNFRVPRKKYHFRDGYHYGWIDADSDEKAIEEAKEFFDA